MRSVILSLVALVVVDSSQRCTNPQGENGDKVTEGCLQRICKEGVWRTSLANNICCYERTAYTINTTISSSISEDGCVRAAIDCVEETPGIAKTMLSMENFCKNYATKEQVEEIKNLLVDQIEGAGTGCHGEIEGGKYEAEKEDDEGILISGGYVAYTSVEVYSPGYHCELPSLPDKMFSHTSDEGTLCGGGATCITFSSGKWVTSHAFTLAAKKYGHTSWNNKEEGKIILMGGWGSDTTTEIITEEEKDGVPGFPMKYETRYACAIPDQTTVIITGGERTPSTVSRYGTGGHIEDLPSLNQGRDSHGCGAYTDDSGEQVLLVVGGQDQSRTYISSTELLRRSSSAWVTVNNLPRKISDMRVARLGGSLYMTGGYEYDEEEEVGVGTDNICKWTGQEWLEVGKMKIARGAHAVSTIKLGEIKDFCT